MLPSVVADSASSWCSLPTKKLRKQESKTFSIRTKEKVTLFSTNASMSNQQMITKVVVPPEAVRAVKEAMETLLAVV